MSDHFNKIHDEHRHLAVQTMEKGLDLQTAYKVLIKDIFAAVKVNKEDSKSIVLRKGRTP